MTTCGRSAARFQPESSLRQLSFARSHRDRASISDLLAPIRLNCCRSLPVHQRTRSGNCSLSARGDRRCQRSTHSGQFNGNLETQVNRETRFVMSKRRTAGFDWFVLTENRGQTRAAERALLVRSRKHYAVGHLVEIQSHRHHCYFNLVGLTHNNVFVAACQVLYPKYAAL